MIFKPGYIFQFRFSTLMLKNVIIKNLCIRHHTNDFIEVLFFCLIYANGHLHDLLRHIQKKIN